MKSLTFDLCEVYLDVHYRYASLLQSGNNVSMLTDSSPPSHILGDKIQY